LTLADYIESDVDALLGDWVAFARGLAGNGAEFSESDLRDAARAMLVDIVRTLRPEQPASPREPEPPQALEREARQHADDRLDKGFALEGLVAEFHNLRASVVRRWREQCRPAGAAALQELARFDAALDQALSASIRRYDAGIRRTRELFVAMLTHDMRSPLGLISVHSQIMAQQPKAADDCRRAGDKILRATRRLQKMIDDLLDVARTRLGERLPLTLGACDLATLCRQAVEELYQQYPGATVRLNLNRLRGRWDCDRMLQMLGNLLGNAARYGKHGGSIVVEGREEAQQVELSVANEGESLTAASIAAIFDPLVRLPDIDGRWRKDPGVGLGLYLSREIVGAHGGSIGVRSSGGWTTFTVRLPREPARPGAEESRRAPA
jgi:signal transduction histidine kinase